MSPETHQISMSEPRAARKRGHDRSTRISNSIIAAERLLLGYHFSRISILAPSVLNYWPISRTVSGEHNSCRANQTRRNFYIHLKVAHRKLSPAIAHQGTYIANNLVPLIAPACTTSYFSIRPSFLFFSLFVLSRPSPLCHFSYFTVRGVAIFMR